MLPIRSNMAGESLENINHNMKKNLVYKMLNFIGFLLVPVLLFYLMEAYEHNAFVEVRPLAQVYNIFLFELMAGLLLFVIGKAKWALRIEILVTLIFGLVNHYVMAFRSTPFVPWDIFSIRTAASVAGNYDFTPTTEVVVVTLLLVVLFVVVRYIDFEIPRKVLWRVIPAGCAAVLLVAFVNQLWIPSFQTKSRLYPYLFTPAHMTKVNGMAVTFAMDMAYVYVEKPEGYSLERAKEILLAYENRKEETEDIELDILNGVQSAEIQDFPNIIVIMNEAFSDPAVLGDFTTNEDYMPYVHQLQMGADNTITGNLTVSVCGGNTANTEYEFLTGNTMDFFPIGSIPYQQYITGEVPSLASQLQQVGYQTYGMHPYNASGWKRDEVYPLLGLEYNYFLGDFTDRHYIRKYVSDETAYDKIIDTYENKENGRPMFVFEVTMQNHGGYTDEYEDFTSDIYVEEFESPALSQYLSLMKVSDQELQDLIYYFSYADEKTIILFFGDHQPNDSVVRPILSWNGMSTQNMSEEDAKKRYIVPYVLWANFDIEENVNADTDISILSAHLLEIANMPTTAYQNFLLEMEDMLKDENLSSEKREEYEQMHAILQYYFVFDYQEE